MSDDDSELMPQVFVVEGDDDEFGLDIPPTSGMEYLRRVQQEASGHPVVLVAEMDRKKFSQNQTVGIKPKDIQSLLAAPTGYGPSQAWMKAQIADFVEVRQSLQHYKARAKKGDVKLDTSVRIPGRDCVDHWCHLCFGKLLRREEAIGDGEDANTFGYPDSGTAPLLSIICRMDQPTAIQVLSYHVNWLEATGFSHLQGQWFYALLSLLEKPLDPEACALIRNLARLCSNLRASLESPQDDKLNALNLIICLVARYFEQKDLGDG